MARAVSLSLPMKNWKRFSVTRLFPSAHQCDLPTLNMTSQMRDDLLNKAKRLVQFPPMVSARKRRVNQVICEDADLRECDSHKVIFFDISYGIAPQVWIASFPHSIKRDFYVIAMPILLSS